MQSNGFKGSQMSRMVKVGNQWIQFDEYLNRKYNKIGSIGGIGGIMNSWIAFLFGILVGLCLFPIILNLVESWWDK